LNRKINIIIPGIIKSGGMNVILEYSYRLKTKGFDIVLYYPFAYYNHYTGKNEYSWNPRRSYWAIKNYIKGRINKKFIKDIKIIGVPFIRDNFVRDANYTIATSWPTSFDVSKLSYHKGIKYYLIQDFEKWDSNVNLVNESYKLDLIRITTCSYLKDKLLTDYGIHSDEILNGIDYDTYFPSIKKDYDTKEKTISYIDYKLEKKNTKLVIEAIKMIRDEFPHVKFKSFGLEKFNEHPSYVKFYKNPLPEEIANIYNESHIFIFASREEGFGLPPAEAMACKTSVISSPVGAVPEYSLNEKSVLFISPENVESIVEKTRLLLNDNILNKSIAENGFSMVRNTLNWENSVEKLIYLLS